MEVKLDALAIATRLAAEKVERMGEQAGHEREAMHAEIDKAAFAMRELLESKLEVVVGQMDEKFAGISRQLEERDERTRTAAQESRISLDAALSAAKEAVQEQNNANSKSISKSEEATAKQLDSLAQLMRTSNQSLDEKIGALKERLDRGEGENRGTEYVRRGEHQAGLDSRSLLFSIIGVVVAVALIALAIVNATGGSP
jgi:cobalamin biosynthesis Mg chelatase CobN